MSKRWKVSKLYRFFFPKKITAPSTIIPNPSEPVYFDAIGKDMTLEIFKCLDIKALIQCQRVSKSFRQLTQDPALKLTTRKSDLERATLNRKYKNGTQLHYALHWKDLNPVKDLIASGLSTLDLNLALFSMVQRAIREHNYKKTNQNTLTTIALLLQAGASIHFKQSIGTLSSPPISILDYTEKLAPRQCRHTLKEIFKVNTHDASPRLRR